MSTCEKGRRMNWCTFLKCNRVSGLRSHISMMSVTPVIKTPVTEMELNEYGGHGKDKM